MLRNFIQNSCVTVFSDTSLIKLREFLLTEYICLIQFTQWMQLIKKELFNILFSSSLLHPLFTGWHSNPVVKMQLLIPL